MTLNGSEREFVTKIQSCLFIRSRNKISKFSLRLFLNEDAFQFLADGERELDAYFM